MRLQRSSELPKPESLVSDSVRDSNNYVVDYSAYADYKRPAGSALTGLAGSAGYDYNGLNSRAGYGGHGGCCCCDQGGGGGDDGGLLGGLGGGAGDLGLLAAGAAAVFLLYQQIIMLMMRRRKRSSLTRGFKGETPADQLSTDLEDVLKGRKFFLKLLFFS